MDRHFVIILAASSIIVIMCSLLLEQRAPHERFRSVHPRRHHPGHMCNLAKIFVATKPYKTHNHYELRECIPCEHQMSAATLYSLENNGEVKPCRASSLGRSLALCPS
eukprot:5341106-Amphidinium_carterae.1